MRKSIIIGTFAAVLSGCGSNTGTFTPPMRGVQAATINTTRSNIKNIGNVGSVIDTTTAGGGDPVKGVKCSCGITAASITP